LLVLPEYQRRGIGTELMRRLMARYEGFISTCLLPMVALWTFIASVGSSAQARPNPCGFTQAMTIDRNMPPKGTKLAFAEAATPIAVYLAASMYGFAFAGEPAWPQFRGFNCSGISDSDRPPVHLGFKNQMAQIPLLGPFGELHTTHKIESQSDAILNLAFSPDLSPRFSLSRGSSRYLDGAV
jgi:hypothetical protein